MNRPTPGQSRTQPSVPAGYRPSHPPQIPSGQPPQQMYYATAGSQTTTGSAGPGRTLPPMNAGGFPPPGVGMPRGPPGFSARTDTSDFPALGSMSVTQSQHLPSSSGTYTSPSQPSGGSNQHLQNQMYLQSGIGGISTPPPGLGGPTTPNSQVNGMMESSRGDEFPALNAGGDGKDSRIANYLRAQQAGHQGPPSPPTSMPNGASNSQSNSATPSTNPPHPSGPGGSSNPDTWPRSSPSRAPEPVTRPAQQILTSPVDQWGLKALLYEIKTQMGNGDRGTLLFGTDLSDLGVDVAAQNALYPSFVTPWLDPSQIQPNRIKESFHTPNCYQFPAPSLHSKLGMLTDDTLLLAFYSSPGDAAQLEAAAELYGRGWRYHTELQIWLTGEHLVGLQLPLPTESAGQPHWVGGAIFFFDPLTFEKREMSPEFPVNAALLEATRPVPIVLASNEEQQQQRKDMAGTRTPPNAQRHPNSIVESTPASMAQYAQSQAAR